MRRPGSRYFVVLFAAFAVSAFSQACGDTNTGYDEPGGSSGGSSGSGSSSGGSSGGSSSGSSSGASSSSGSSGGSSSGSGAGSSSGSGDDGGGSSSSGSDDGGSSSGSGSGSSSSSSSGSSSGGADGGLPSCAYTNDAQFCQCLGAFNCGGITTQDSSGKYQSVYCGTCPSNQLCLSSAPEVIVGQCGGTNPFQYTWQWDMTQALVSLGENDNPTPSQNYSYCQNIKDGRGYTIGKVGFCTGTADFVLVAACYNDAKPGNVLQKYWPALTQLADEYFTMNMNIADTSPIDTIAKAAGTTFKADIATAAKDPLFTGCQDGMAAAEDVGPAAWHYNKLHLTGALTLGFLYDTELNFGEGDDPPMADGAPGTAGAGTIVLRATADYGANMPADFTGKPWEESRWLGFLIYERALTMSKDPTWSQDMDQDGTWEAARRLHTGTSNNPESNTDLSMGYNIASAYKAAYKTPTPCWGDPPLASAIDAMSSVWTLGVNKVNAADPTTWTLTQKSGGSYAACPANPTP